MKKQVMALLIVLTIVLAGAAGFGGSYAAQRLEAQGGEIAVGANLENNVIAVATTKAAAATTKKAATTTKSGTTAKATTAKVLSIPEVASKNANSVVEIYTEHVVRNRWLIPVVAEGGGSGVIIKSNGYIVTSSHIINGARKITVRLKNGTEYSAALVGEDTQKDIAVIKIEATDLKAVTYGDSSKLVVGELAVVIGNPLGLLGGSVTEGIISALSRSITIDGNTMSLLQTSAAINPGNSGGGLFDKHGKFVGLVTAKSSGTDIEGLGFAIPANTVKDVVKTLMG